MLLWIHCVAPQILPDLGTDLIYINLIDPLLGARYRVVESPAWKMNRTVHCLFIFHFRFQAQAREQTQPDSATTRQSDGAMLVREFKNTLRDASSVPDPVTRSLNSTGRDHGQCGLGVLLTNFVEGTFTCCYRARVIA